MKSMIKIIVTLFPALVILLLPQLRNDLDQYVAVAMILLTLATAQIFCRSSDEKWRHLARQYLLGTGLAYALLMLCIFFPVGGFIAQPLHLEHSQENAEAILVMASGATLAKDPGLSGFQRVLHGIELLKQNRAPLLLVSTGFSEETGFAEAEWVASLTHLCQVEPERLMIFRSERIRTSKTEADYAIERLGQLGIKRILLVTSGTHLFRGKKVFEKLGIQVLPAPCHSSAGLYYSMGHYLRSLDATLHEWIGLVYYRLRNFI
jgi:uncharacterized SAM-binding protein YcdF (DUF218 family)